MDEAENPIPSTEGEVQSPTGRLNQNCLNCGTPLRDMYCHHCGQKDIPRRQTLGELWSNFISSFWSYEGKFLQTTRYLLTRPGFLAMEYNSGRRESYYHPARMYAFISFVFFLIFFSIQDTDKADEVDEKLSRKLSAKDSVRSARVADSVLTRLATDSVAGKLMPEGLADSIKTVVRNEQKKNKKGTNISLSGSDYKSIEEYDSLQALKPESERDGWFERRMTLRSIELNKRFKNSSNGFGKEFGKAFMDNFSKVLFFLLPFFALVLKLLYVRRDYFYSEHLVFSIYYYNFCYLAGSVQLLLGELFDTPWISIIMSLWILGYLLFGMKRMYGQSWRKTIAKYVLFGITFTFVAIVGFSINALVILFVL